MGYKQPLTKSHARLMTFIVCFMVIVAPLTIDEYAPSFPAMTHLLNTSIAWIQLSLSIFLVSFAVSQIIVGPLSDRFGRRRLIILNTPIFFIGSLLCIYANSISTLLIGRVLQGFGVGALGLSASAIIADVFSGDELNHVTSLFSIIYSFVPIAAPVIGGFLQDWFGWRANFVFIGLFALVAYVFFLFKLPETHPASKQHAINFSVLTKTYRAVLSHKKYMLSVITLLFIWSGVICFSVLAPFIIQNTFKYTAAQYGGFALFIGFGFMLGGIFNTILIKKNNKSNMTVGLSFSLISSILFFALCLGHNINVFSMIILSFLFMIGSGVCFPNVYAKALSAIPEYPGISNALIGAIMLIGTTIITAFITQVHAHQPISLSVTLLILCGVTTLLNRLH